MTDPSAESDSASYISVLCTVNELILHNLHILLLKVFNKNVGIFAVKK